MLHTSIIESDAFYKLPIRSQVIYLHMCMLADDEGFCTQAGRVRQLLRAKQSELDTLVERGYLYKFRTGLYLIIHWRIHNHVRRDRGCSSAFSEERKRVFICHDKSYHVVDQTMSCNEISRYADAHHMSPLFGFIFDNDCRVVDTDQIIPYETI